jgi:hypothetical protein
MRQRPWGSAVLALLALLWLGAAARGQDRLRPGDAPAVCPSTLSYIAADPLRVRGTEVLDRYGVRYVPYGISVIGLEQRDGLTPRIEHAVENEIAAATGPWHANTIRLQVAAWLSRRNPQAFWRVLDREVEQISCAGDVVVLNDNSLFTTHEHNPTALDQAFVAQLAARYRNRNNVIIDPFNEPHLGGDPRQPIQGARMWRLWRSGGWVDGRRYVGMQSLINVIRRAGDHNPLWIEPPHWSNAFDRLDRYPLRGRNLVIEFHHPNLSRSYEWDRMLRPTRQPRVEGEESQYAALRRPECDPTAYRTLPRLLRLLVRYGDGLMAWTLEPGVLVAPARGQSPPMDTIPGWYPATEAALTRPNALRRNYNCTAQGQGMGELTMRVLRRYAAAANPYGPL